VVSVKDEDDESRAIRVTLLALAMGEGAQQQNGKKRMEHLWQPLGYIA
jgi:hypothetical protein